VIDGGESLADACNDLLQEPGCGASTLVPKAEMDISGRR
jgi:hypothetical protein